MLDTKPQAREVHRASVPLRRGGAGNAELPLALARVNEGTDARLPVQASKAASGERPGEPAAAAGMGIVEAWVREKPIRTFLARLAQRRGAAAAAFLASATATAAIDGEGGGEESIPQLSAIANSVVSRCSRYASPLVASLLRYGLGIEV